MNQEARVLKNPRPDPDEATIEIDVAAIQRAQQVAANINQPQKPRETELEKIEPPLRHRHRFPSILPKPATRRLKIIYLSIFLSSLVVIGISITLAILLHKPPLEFISNPMGAEVFINGEKAGISPYRTTLPTGRHIVEMRKNGFENQQQVIEVLEGGRIVPID